MEDKKNEKEKKKVKGGRVQVGKRMPAGRKAVVTHHSSSDSSHEEEGEDGTRESQVRPDVLCPGTNSYLYKVRHTQCISYAH